MLLKKVLLCAMAFAAVLAFSSCDDSSSSDGYYFKFTLDGKDYNYTRGFSDGGSKDAFGNFFTDVGICVVATPDCPLGDAATMCATIACNGNTTGNFSETFIGLNPDGGVGEEWISENSIVSISKYGDVNGVIAGSFIGTFTRDTTTVDGQGTFRVIRVANETFSPMPEAPPEPEPEP